MENSKTVIFKSGRGHLWEVVINFVVPTIGLWPRKYLIFWLTGWLYSVGGGGLGGVVAHGSWAEQRNLDLTNFFITKSLV